MNNFNDCWIDVVANWSDTNQSISRTTLNTKFYCIWYKKNLNLSISIPFDHSNSIESPKIKILRVFSSPSPPSNAHVTAHILIYQNKKKKKIKLDLIYRCLNSLQRYYEAWMRFFFFSLAGRSMSVKCFDNEIYTDNGWENEEKLTFPNFTTRRRLHHEQSTLNEWIERVCRRLFCLLLAENIWHRNFARKLIHDGVSSLTSIGVFVCNVYM